FVQRGQADGNGEPLPLLRLDKPAQVRELGGTERVLHEPLVDELADDATAVGAIRRQRGQRDRELGADRRRRAHDDRGARVRDDGLTDRTEWILLILPARRSEDDRVVL